MNYYNKPRKTTKPLKAVLLHTRSNEMTSSELYKIIQRVLVDNEDYFQIDRSQFKWNPLKSEEVKQELVKKIQLDKIPAWFEEQFKLDFSNPDIKNQIVDIFADAVSLNDEKWKRSDRVVFSHGRVMISKNENHPVHTDDKKHTQWEKRVSENKTTLLTFWNIYDALRSQYHATENMWKDKEKSLALLKDILQLSVDIKESLQFSKDDELKRKLNDIIEGIGDVRDFNTLSAKLYQLEQLSNNKAIAGKQLEWAANKFKKRFDALSDMLGFISFRDIPKLEEIVEDHEYILNMLFYRVSSNPKNCIYLYKDAIYRLPESFKNIAPFSEYYKRIVESKDLESAKIEIQKIREAFNLLKVEHTEKK